MHYLSFTRILRVHSMPIHTKPKPTKLFSWTNFNENIKRKNIGTLNEI